jgi:hypothetical protein
MNGPILLVYLSTINEVSVRVQKLVANYCTYCPKWFGQEQPKLSMHLDVMYS